MSRDISIKLYNLAARSSRPSILVQFVSLLIVSIRAPILSYGRAYLLFLDSSTVHNHSCSTFQVFLRMILGIKSFYLKI